MTKNQLITTHRHRTGTLQHTTELRTWRKDELITAVLNHEHPGAPATTS